MSHKPLTDLSPRFSVALELSDTLLCLGFLATRSRVMNSHRVSFEGGHIDIGSPFSMTAKLNGERPEKFRGAEDAKKYLIRKLA